ncbi:hypothetical protein FF38_03589 [Lucilia cuprina]|uniref:Uncharacterized protein n=1 Tax=Lucilia cuprina TaxID=7375 RepID=A0A0L0BSF2_LUCCU|nr:hypothetical protein FF38_03589 [Lucilia cuprina]
MLLKTPYTVCNAHSTDLPFSIEDDRLIGLKSLGFEWHALPALGIEITLTSLHLLGRYPVRRHLLKISERSANASSEILQSMAGKTPSGPATWEDRRTLISICRALLKNFNQSVFLRSLKGYCLDLLKFTVYFHSEFEIALFRFTYAVSSSTSTLGGSIALYGMYTESNESKR